MRRRSGSIVSLGRGRKGVGGSRRGCEGRGCRGMRRGRGRRRVVRRRGRSSSRGEWSRSRPGKSGVSHCVREGRGGTYEGRGNLSASCADWGRLERGVSPVEGGHGEARTDGAALEQVRVRGRQESGTGEAEKAAEKAAKSCGESRCSSASMEEVRAGARWKGRSWRERAASKERRRGAWPSRASAKMGTLPARGEVCVEAGAPSARGSVNEAEGSTARIRASGGSEQKQSLRWVWTNLGDLGRLKRRSGRNWAGVGSSFQGFEGSELIRW